jgi:hypothetical protein
MKEYSKPTIEFIELRPEERLACSSGKGGSGCCGTNIGYKGYYYWLVCWYAVPVWILCDCLKKKFCW